MVQDMSTVLLRHTLLNSGKLVEIVGTAGMIYGLAKSEHEVLWGVGSGLVIYAGKLFDDYVKLGNLEAKTQNYSDKNRGPIIYG